jgi:hypothetical protein
MHWEVLTCERTASSWRGPREAEGSNMLTQDQLMSSRSTSTSRSTCWLKMLGEMRRQQLHSRAQTAAHAFRFGGRASSRQGTRMGCSRAGMDGVNTCSNVGSTTWRCVPYDGVVRSAWLLHDPQSLVTGTDSRTHTLQCRAYTAAHALSTHRHSSLIHWKLTSRPAMHTESYCYCAKLYQLESET